MKRLTPFLACFALISLLAGLSLFGQIDPQSLAALKARSIGPANMSGRIAAIDGVAANPSILYVGAAAGGVWKSEDRGITWKPVFDDQPVASIGAIAINQENPSVVWVGTGEAAVRNSVSIGRGVYLTSDGGKSWKRLGLEKTEKISKILLDPRNPDVAYVGALGATWGDSTERGVYKTSDGGKTWENILYVNEKTGVADMAMDPRNPNKLIVAMWEHRRWPWFFNSGGPGSGLHLTSDGGKTWKKLTDKDGLPKGDLGRCGLAFSASKSEIAYALVEAKKSVLLRSNDGGFTWTTINEQENLDNRPFYYSRIWVNPVNENILYMLHSQFMVSEDAGKTFRATARMGQAHSDHHALWIAPDGEMLVAGNDGGVVISNNRGKTWQFVANLPVGQFYHVNYDMEIPYNLYGGLQDNGSWRGPAWVLERGGISTSLWKTVGGGDGFDTAADPENSKAGYGMSQGGNLYYFDVTSGSSRDIVPTEADVKERYNWNAAFAIDPFQPATIYLCSQFVHRSKDKGRTWEIISSDLTSNDPTKQKQAESGGLTLDVSNAENHCTITVIAPSPLKEGTLWVGTDDGNIQLTRDAGKTWELVSKPLYAGKKPLAPANTWVTHIKASRFDAATAFAVLDDHRRSNFATYVFVTRDYGKTWKSLATPDIDGYAFSFAEDTVNRNLLFLGTEFGLWVSFNGGANWQKWTAGVPTTPVHDLAVQPRDSDLIVATHGRSFYVIDDITPLREITPDITKKKLHLFSIPTAYLYQQGGMSTFLSPGDTMFAGENKPQGAVITYFLTPSEKKEEEKSPEAPPDPLRQQMMERLAAMGGMGRFAGMMGGGSSRVVITILDKDGRQVARLNGPETKGINRAYWNMRETMPQREEQAQAEPAFFFRGGGGLQVLPGIYTVKIKYDNKDEVSGTVEVKPDPRLKVDLEMLKANYATAKAAQTLSQAITDAGRRLQDTQKAIQTVLDFGRANRSPNLMNLMKAARDLESKRKALAEEMNPTPPKQGMTDRSASLNSQVMGAVGGMTGAGYEPISQAARVRYEKAKVKAATFLEKLNKFFAEDVESFKKLLKDLNFTLFSTYEPLKLEKK